MTGLTAFEWLLLGSYALCLALLVRSIFPEGEGRRVSRILVVPVVAGLAFTVLLTALWADDAGEAFSRVPDRASAVLVAAAAVVVAAAVVDFLFTRLVAPAVDLVERTTEPGAGRSNLYDGVLAVGLAATMALVLVALVKLKPSETTAANSSTAATETGARVVGQWAIGDVTDVLLTSSRTGYVALNDGRVSRFELPERAGGKLSLHTVAGGLDFPRGLAMIGKKLFVSELGPLPCREENEHGGLGNLQCKGENVDRSDMKRGESVILERSRGRVLAFDVEGGGELGEPRVIVSDLPVVDSQHGVNGLTAGPDGRLYLAIGNLDRLFETPHIAGRLGRPRADLLGTVVRFGPDGSHFEVLARGLRNVYDLAFDHAGHLYGADNDGFTIRDWRREELLELVKGANYGYPYEGTFGPHQVRTKGPLWVMDSGGSAGIEWTGDLSLTPGLLVGSCGELTHVPLALRQGAPVVYDEHQVKALANPMGCVTGIKVLSRRTLVIGLVPFVENGKAPSLLVLELA
jgi:glucose/arabinose dehydrogenase